MAFSQTSRNIRLSGQSVLEAECRRRDGTWRASALDLDRVLGNHNGQFAPSYEIFSHTSQSCSLQGCVLHAQLQDQYGAWQSDSVDLDVLVSNEDGSLTYSISAIYETPWRIAQVHARSMTTDCVREYDALKARIVRDINAEVNLARQHIKTALTKTLALREDVGSLSSANDNRSLRQLLSPLANVFKEAVSQQEAALRTVSTASQLLVEFRNVTFEYCRQIWRHTEELMEEEIRRIEAAVMETNDLLQSLETQVSSLERQRELVQQRASDARNQTIGYSIASSENVRRIQVEDANKSQASVFLPFVFVPLAINASGNNRESEEEMEHVNHIIEQQRIQTTQKRRYLNEARIALDEIRREEYMNQTLSVNMDGFQKQLDDLRQELYLHKVDITAQLVKLSAVQTRDVMDLRACESSESAISVLKRVLTGMGQRPLRYTAITQ